MERHEVTSEQKDTAYIATVLLFNNVKQMALNKIGGWVLHEAVTDNHRNHYVTEYRNGKMFVRAVSFGSSHVYSFGSAEES